MTQKTLEQFVLLTEAQEKQHFVCTAYIDTIHSMIKRRASYNGLKDWEERMLQASYEAVDYPLDDRLTHGKFKLERAVEAIPKNTGKKLTPMEIEALED
jgi:hypothetical protein